MSALDVQSMPTIPTDMDYSIPDSLPAARAREVRVSPINGNSFTVSTSQQILQFDIPCGASPGDYLDPTTTYVRFKVAFSSAGASGTDISRILGSGYSFFNLQRVLGNNSSVIEEIPEVGVLVNMLTQCQLSEGDKRGLSSMLGFAFDSTVDVSSATAGCRIFANSTTEGLNFEFAVPLIGILGANSDKMIPVGKILGLRLELTCDVPANFIAATTANLVSQYVISEIEFVGNYITLGPESQAIIDKLNPQRIIIRSQSWKQTSANIAASSGVGTQELLCNIRVNSLKSIYLACSIPNANEKKFSGVNPNLSSGTCWLIGGQNYPQRGLDPSNKPGDCFAELQRSFGALNFAQYNSCISKNDYFVSSTASGLMSAYNTTIGTIMTQSNQFFMGVDLEVLARKGSLLTGISTYGSGLMFRANIGATVAAQAHTLNFFGFYDLILEIDVNSKNIIAKY